MEKKKPFSKDRKPQPRIGMLVVAFDFYHFKQQLEYKRLQAEVAKNDSEYVRHIKEQRARFEPLKPSTFPLYHIEKSIWGRDEFKLGSYVQEGTIGVVVKGNGQERLLVAFGGATGWIDSRNVAPLDWYQWLKEPGPDGTSPPSPSGSG